MVAPKTIRRVPSFYSCAEILCHLDAECERAGHRLSHEQQQVFHELRIAPNERALSLMHDWWCYDFEKLAPEFASQSKPRVSLSIWLNQRGTLIISWCPTSPHGDSLKDSDFRVYPYLTGTNENRLIEVREFRFVMPFHRRRDESEWPASTRRKATDISDNHVVSNALLLQATARVVSELKNRLSYCFKITMVEDIYIEWAEGPKGSELVDTLLVWEIENVAEHERKLALKLLDEFELTYGCPLTVFVDVMFRPEQKRPTGPAPAAHTKIDRSAKHFKSLGSPKLTPSVIKRYLGLLETYRDELLPIEARKPSNVVPFNPKQ